MARIPLRKYVQEIEVLIENGNLEEAQKHCWYILQTYPKHIQTYRLLGKILMQRGSYEDSLFVFNKITEVYPDDFISHIGLSFLAEMNNQLDDAVFHMEQAFEMQPTNAMLREELKRLHLKKDGVEPQTIRLTRGALINMYLRSELYPQAIAELRIGLQTNPTRIDFKARLAQALLAVGDKIEAVQKCIEMLGIAPFNFTANQIVYETLPKTSEAMDTEAFHQHLIDIDPYYTYVGTKIQDVADVPDVAINIERYDGSTPEIVLETIQWQQAISDFWEQPSIWKPEREIDSDIDWDMIIETRLTERATVKVDEGNQSSIIEDTQEIAVRDEEEVEELPVPEEFEVPEKNPVTDIPDWIFSEDEPQEDGVDQQERQEPADLPSFDVELDPEEMGMVDFDVPAISEPESEAISQHWVKIEEEKSEIPQPDLEDTQKISGLEDSQDRFNKALQAFQAQDYKKALQQFDASVEDGSHLDQIVETLEKEEILLETSADAWFLLGKAYLKLNRKEKALEAFRRAEEITL